MMIFCMLDPPEDLHEYTEGLEALLSHMAVEEPRTNWNNHLPGQRRLPETLCSITYTPTSRPVWEMTLRRIRMKAQTGLPLSQSEGEAFARAGLLPYRPLGSPTESVLTALLISLAPDGDLMADYVIQYLKDYLGAILLQRGRHSQAVILITSLYPDLHPVNLVLKILELPPIPVSLHRGMVGALLGCPHQ